MEYLIKNKKIKLITSAKVFKPTQTSKFLLDEIVKDYKFKKIIALDMGCGNGIIGISLLKVFKNFEKFYFTDLSQQALNLTRKNIINNKISLKNIKLLKSDVFKNLESEKFDLIINDVSGISEKLLPISSWFKNVPCNSGSDGTDLTIEVLKNFKLYLSKKGKMYLPIISLSNEKKIFKFLNKNKIKYKIISKNYWPLPKELYKSLNLLNKLKLLNYINFEKKFNMLIANTKIVKITN